MPHRLKKKKKIKETNETPNCGFPVLYLPRHSAARQLFPAISSESGANDTNMQIIFETLSGQKSLDPTEMSVFFHFFLFPLRRAEKRKTVCSSKKSVKLILFQVSPVEAKAWK